MKICLVHHEYPEETSMGGIATYQRMLATTLKKLGNDVTVIAASLDDDKEEYDEGVHVIRFSKCIQYDTIEYMEAYREKVADKLHELYLNNELDVVESPEMGAECLRYIEKYHDVPVVGKLHTSFELWAEFNETTLPEDVHKKLVEWERSFVEKADAVLSCTNLLYGMMKERNQIKRNDVIVLGNPANVDRFYHEDEVKDNSVLYLGGLEQRKGVLILAKAIPLVLQKYPDLKFKFIGNDTKSNDKNISTIEYIKEIVPAEYHQNMEFIKHINNSEVKSYCSKSIMGVLPSTFDNLPYVAMEELLCELPCVASDNTGVKEMIDNNESGLLFKSGDHLDLANKIMYLYGNPEIRNDMAKKGREEIIKRFKPENIVLKNLDVYFDAINKFWIKKHFNDVKNIKLIPYGIANSVYEVETENSNYAIKCYHSKMKKNNIAPITYDQNNNEFYSSELIYEDDNRIIMDYINGQHKTNLSNEEIDVICNFIKYFSQNYNAEVTLENKINSYQNLKSTKRKDVEKALDDFWNKNSFEIKELFSNVVTSHGDLSSTNIIFNNNKISVIDYDEVCLAPKYYDYVVFALKHSFVNGSFNEDELNRFIDIYKSHEEDFDINSFKLTLLVYLYKILKEKIYWEATGLINLEDEYQKQDNYIMYFELFKKLVTTF